MLLLVVAIGAITLGGSQGAPPVTLTIFTGTATILRSGGTAAVAARSSDGLASGDTLATGSSGKAAIGYPDGSMTRLDSNTTITVTTGRQGGAVRTSLQQSAGRTWNKIQPAAGAATLKFSGPNSASTEVRGAVFGFYIEHDTTGAPVTWIDAWSGSVPVTGTRGSVLVAAGQRVTVRAKTPPTVPVPIPAGDLQLSFTVFNQTLDAVSGKPVVFSSGTLGSANGTPYFTVEGDGLSDLQFVLGWPGSIYQLTVVDPSGILFARPASSAPPLKVVVPRAIAGTWRFSVRDVQSAPDEAWWVVVART
jgi:hypothetical protein